MKFWLVVQVYLDRGDYRIRGIFSSLEKAKEKSNAYLKENNYVELRTNVWHDCCDYVIFHQEEVDDNFIDWNNDMLKANGHIEDGDWDLVEEIRG